MRVLITGGTGFIGSRVAAVTRGRGHDVTVLTRRPLLPAQPHVVHDLERLDGLAQHLSGFDVVIHCAATMEGSAERQRATTVQGTHNLVSAMQAAGVQRLILVSSFAVYDYTALTPDATLTENTPLDADSGVRGPYVAAKRGQEQQVMNSGLAWTVVRPGLVFGQGRTWFYHLGARLPGFWVTMAGAGILPLTQVDNCADAIASVADAPRSLNAVINIVDSALPSRKQYVAWLAEQVANRPRIVDVPWGVLSAASRSAWAMTHGVLRDVVMPPGSLHPAVLAARCKPLRYDNSRARELLGWEPRIPVRDGLRKALGAGF